MTLAAIIGLLTALIPLINRFWPTQGEKVREKQKEVEDGNRTFNETRDTSDLGKLP